MIQIKARDGAEMTYLLIVGDIDIRSRYASQMLIEEIYLLRQNFISRSTPCVSDMGRTLYSPLNILNSGTHSRDQSSYTSHNIIKASFVAKPLI